MRTPLSYLRQPSRGEATFYSRVSVSRSSRPTHDSKASLSHSSLHSYYFACENVSLLFINARRILPLHERVFPHTRLTRLLVVGDGGGGGGHS